MTLKASAPTPSVQHTGEIAIVLLKRAGLGAWLMARWLTLSHLGNRLVVFVLACSLTWALVHPHNAAVIVRTVIQQSASGVTNAQVRGVRPALATAEARSSQRAHDLWLLHVWLPRHTAHARYVRPVIVTTNSAAPDAALIQSVYAAFSAYAEPYTSLDIAQEVVQLGQTFGVDPAVVAGLYLHEDGNIAHECTAGRCHWNDLLAHTRNPGNVKCMYSPCFGGFQVYPSYRAAIADWFRLYDHYWYDLGIHDLGRFIAVYCPPNSDGNGPVAGYTNDVTVKADAIRKGW